MLRLQDAAGNLVLQPNLPSLSVRAVIVPGPSRHQSGGVPAWTAPFLEGQFAFKDVKVVAEYGREYRLRCVVEGQPGIRPITSAPIVATPCANSTFFEVGAIQCRPCVTGAVCNGSAVLVTDQNYWRSSNESLDFLPCTKPSDLSEPCEGGAVAHKCRPHFEGPLCAFCEADYTGPNCVKCPASVFPPVMELCSFFALYLLTISFTMYQVRALHRMPRARVSPPRQSETTPRVLP